MRKEPGVTIVSGNFASGKTFGTIFDVYNVDKKEYVIISNIPYSCVDIFFDTVDEFKDLLLKFMTYARETNNNIIEYFYKGEYKKIIFILDEAHLYFDARKFSNNELLDQLDIFLSQCRKRQIYFYMITQRFARLDKNIRRFTDFLLMYRKTDLRIISRSKVSHHYLENDIADIDEMNGAKQQTVVVSKDGKRKDPTLMYKEMFRPLFKIFGFAPFATSKKLKDMKLEYYVTYYICGIGAKPDFSDQFMPIHSFFDVIKKEKPKPKEEENAKPNYGLPLPFGYKLVKTKQLPNPPDFIPSEPTDDVKTIFEGDTEHSRPSEQPDNGKTSNDDR